MNGTKPLLDPVNIPAIVRSAVGFGEGRRARSVCALEPSPRSAAHETMGFLSAPSWFVGFLFSNRKLGTVSRAYLGVKTGPRPRRVLSGAFPYVVASSA